MKKIFNLLTIAAAAAVIAVSCNTKDKKDSNNASGLDTPALDQYAFSVSISDPRPEIPLPETRTPDGNSFSGSKQIAGDADKGQLLNIEAMNDGTWNADFKVKDEDGGQSDFSFSGNFDIQGQKLSVGDIYVLASFGNLEITALDGNSISFQFTPLAGGDPIMFDGTLAAAISGDASLLADAARGWSVEKTFITIKGESIPAAGIGGEYNGCNVSAIANDLKKQGLKIDASKVSYSITKVSLSKYGTIRIYLSNNDVIEGKIKGGKLSGSEFEYEFEVFDKDNPVLSANGSGSIKIVKGKLNLELSGNLKDNENKVYNALVKFILAYK